MSTFLAKKRFVWYSVRKTGEKGLSFVDTQWLLVGMELAAILLGTLVVLCIAEWVGCKALCGLAAAIFIILMVAHSDGEPITYSILRSAQTVIGIFIAWLINVKLFPYPGKKKKEL